MAQEPEGADTLFEDAVDALRQGERPRGKEILTRLLKADQNNPTYWIWMSVAVDTAKERIYCLETALKLDPQNATAKRGLVLLGGLSPDENVQPFPLNHPRAWEEDLLLAHEKPQDRSLGALMARPGTRIAGVSLIGLAVLAAAVYVFAISPRNSRFRPSFGGTAGPSPTFTLTPTFVNATGVIPTVRKGPTPLAVLMGVSYTPTALYVNTPRAPISGDIYRTAKQALERGDLDTYIEQMLQVQKAEPEAADVPYYIGEAYRAKGNCREALNFYNQSLQVDNKFAAGYLGLARARICIDPGADTNALYDLAIQSDPNYAEPYLDRANWHLVRKDYRAALPDLDKADTLTPDSAVLQVAYAQAYLLAGNNVKALEAAQKANSTDLTLLPSYYYLGAAYSANAQYAESIKPLQVYLIYVPKDAGAYALLGRAQTETGDYKAAIDSLQQALKYDPNQVRSYLYLGICSLRTDDVDKAVDYFKRDIQFFPDSFDANIGLTEAMYREGTFGSAYLQSETSRSKATDDSQRALAIYWRAMSQEGRGNIADAAADWKTLLAMSNKVTTAEMRKTAQDHLTKLVTPSPTPRGGIKTATPTLTPKPSGSGTPTSTATPTP